MNECFFIGIVLKVEDFKFIISPNKKHKSQIKMQIKLLDGNVINAVAYDNKADYVFRKKFLNHRVYIDGYLTNRVKQILVNIKFIKNI